MADNGKQLLIDRYVFKPTLLEDKRTEGGKLIARGEFARADVATENKRLYPRSLWEREIKRLEPTIVARKMFGEADHPMDGRTSLKRVSHIITGLTLENGVLVGEAELLPTAEGNNLRAIFEAGGQIGVSSRGFGTTRPNTEGIDVVQDDYRLMTFDFVAEPANVTSYPSVHVEAKQKSKRETPMSEALTLDALRTSNPALFEGLMQDAEREYEKRAAELWAKKLTAAKDEATTDLRASFAEQLQQAVVDAKAEIEDQLRGKLMNDPSVAGAKAALESIKDLLRPYVIPEDVETIVKQKEQTIEDLQNKIVEHEKTIAKLSEQNEKLAGLAKEAGYRFHLEGLLRDVPQADLIRKIVGDVKQYESRDSINARVTEVVEEIKKANEKHVERDREMEHLREENEKLRLANEKSLEATKLLTVQNYIESRLANHPKAGEIRMVLESVSPTSKEDVDRVLGKFREKKSDPAALDEARARVRQMVGSGTRETIVEHEERGNQAGGNGVVSNYNGLGNSVESLRALSGIGNDQN